MKRIPRLMLWGTCVLGCCWMGEATGSVNVTEYHNHPSRDGLYIDPAFTKAAAAGLTRDLDFNGSIVGNVYAQPLYIEGGGAAAMVIAVTESNNVYALDATTGTVIWQRNLGTPVPHANLPCGTINPLGITGTPVADLVSRTLFFDVVTTPDGGVTIQHLIYAVSVDTGTTLSGWPVDVGATATSGTNLFAARLQNQHGALAFVNGTVYVPYGGHNGDCGSYHGWVVGIPLANPAAATAWATSAVRGGIWAVGGIASDGTNVFVATGNTSSTFGTWGGGEAIVRLPPNLAFSGLPVDYWAPANWLTLDSGDIDLGGSGPLLVDVPGATPSQLLLALGKDGNGYVLNRTNLGGISAPVVKASVASGAIIQAAVTYRTAQGTYFAICHGNNVLTSRITSGSPPAIPGVWGKSAGGTCSPFVTSTDGTNDMVVWGLGAEGDQRLHGFDGDTGAIVYAGGDTNELMSGTHRYQTAIAARGRIYVANDNKVFAFTVGIPPIHLVGVTFSSSNTFQFAFTNLAGLSFTVMTTTNAASSPTAWTAVGHPDEIAPGTFVFSGVAAAEDHRFYRVRSP